MKLFKNKAFLSLFILLMIALVSGALLAIFHDLFAVSDEERAARSFRKIYGEDVSAEKIELSEDARTYEKGEVLSLYLVEDGNYLLESKGTGGYKGTVTVWTIFSCTGSKAAGTLQWTGLGKVVYGSDENESLINNITEEFYLSFTEHNAEVLEGKYFTTQQGGDGLFTLNANVTRTSTAIVNAVNTAIECFKTQILEVEA